MHSLHEVDVIVIVVTQVVYVVLEFIIAVSKKVLRAIVYFLLHLILLRRDKTRRQSSGFDLVSLSRVGPGGHQIVLDAVGLNIFLCHFSRLNVNVL
jgi:hypothetical protein